MRNTFRRTDKNYIMQRATNAWVKKTEIKQGFRQANFVTIVEPNEDVFRPDVQWEKYVITWVLISNYKCNTLKCVNCYSKPWYYF